MPVPFLCPLSGYPCVFTIVGRVGGKQLLFNFGAGHTFVLFFTVDPILIIIMETGFCHAYMYMYAHIICSIQT